MNKQLSKKEAVTFYAAEDWKNWTDEEIVKFQLFQDRLCVPFVRFHAAMEQVLARPIWTHEFAQSGRLREEYLKDRPAPSLEEVLAQIPEEKLIAVI